MSSVISLDLLKTSFDKLASVRKAQPEIKIIVLSNITCLMELRSYANQLSYCQAEPVEAYLETPIIHFQQAQTDTILCFA